MTTTLTEAVLDITVPGEPRSKSRPRFTGSGKVYSDKRQREHEKLLSSHMRNAMGSRQPWTAGLEINLVFFRSNRQRIDVDNLIKAALDAATGIIWVDDVQVVSLSARIELDRENPRTRIHVGQCSTSMPRGSEAIEIKKCPTCGEKFESRAYDSKPDGQVYCSKACVGMTPIDCPTCGEEFKPRGSNQRYCGKKCAASAAEVKKKIAAKRRHADLPHCVICGTGLHRRNATLCRECWLKEAPKGQPKSKIIETLERTGKISTRRHRSRAAAP